MGYSSLILMGNTKKLDKIIKKPYLDFFLIFILGLLACFHIPVKRIGEDSIGLFDIYIFFYFGYSLMRVGNKRLVFPEIWKEYFLVVFLYLSYLLFRISDIQEMYILMLWVKNLEYFIVFFLVALTVINYSEYKRELISIIQIVFIIMAVYQLGYRFGIINWGFSPRYRIGLPLTIGVSSNPAGFVMGAFLVFSIKVVIAHYDKNWIVLVSAVLVSLAMFFTISRTNLLALLIVIFIMTVEKSLKSKKGILLVLSAVIIFVIVVRLFDKYLSKSSHLWIFIKILNDPSYIFKDASFGWRYTYHWPLAISRWMSTTFTFLFGTGFGSMKVVDGTIPRLLGNQGFVGFLLFHVVWFLLPLYYFPKNKALKYLLLFAFINGINGETLIVSYRSVQVYVIILGYTIFMYPDDKATPSNMIYRFFNRYIKERYK